MSEASEPPPPLAVVAWVRSRHAETDHTPVQPVLNPDDRAEVHVDPAYADALDGLGGFDFLWLVSWLQRNGQTLGRDVPQRQIPYLMQRPATEIGIFATRGPRRLSPIGLHLVRLLGIDGAVLHIAGVDLLDGTPIVDLKPWVRTFDTPYGPTAAAPRSGWFDDVALELGATPATLRPTDGR